MKKLRTISPKASVTMARKIPRILRAGNPTRRPMIPAAESSCHQGREKRPVQVNRQDGGNIGAHGHEAGIANGKLSSGQRGINAQGQEDVDSQAEVKRSRK